MANYRLAPNAKADLERIWLYGLEQWGLTRADAYIEDLHKRFSEIAEHPLKYPAVEDVRAGHRRSVFKSDSIYYRVDGSDVEVMAIIGSQDIENWL